MPKIKARIPTRASQLPPSSHSHSLGDSMPGRFPGGPPPAGASGGAEAAPDGGASALGAANCATVGGGATGRAGAGAEPGTGRTLSSARKRRDNSATSAWSPRTVSRRATGSASPAVSESRDEPPLPATGAPAKAAPQYWQKLEPWGISSPQLEQFNTRSLYTFFPLSARVYHQRLKRTAIGKSMLGEEIVRLGRVIHSHRRPFPLQGK